MLAKIVIILSLKILMFLSKQIYQPIEGSNYGILCTKKFHLSLVFIIFIIISCLRSIHVSIYIWCCYLFLPRWQFHVSKPTFTWFHGFKMEREGREYPPLSSLREAHQFFSNIKISTEVILEIIIVCGICKTHFHIDIEIHNTYR